jgi:hypothetical protein
MKILEIVGLVNFTWDEYGKLLCKFDDAELQIHGEELYLIENKESGVKVTKYNLIKEWEQDSE